MGASKLLHRILNCDLWPWPLTTCYKMLQNATPSPFLTWFWFRLLYVVALGEGFKNSTQNFDFWLLWPLTLIFFILLQNATPSPFLTRFRFRLFYVIALGEGFKTSTQNFDLWLLWPLTLIFDLYCTLATKCYSSAISILILIPFASCDSTRWGLQNSYAEFWPLTFILTHVYCTLATKMLLCHLQPDFDSAYFMW